MPDPIPAPAPSTTPPPSDTPPVAVTAPANPPAAPVAAGVPPSEAPAQTPGQSAEVVYTLALPAESVLDASAVDRVTALAKAAKLDPATAQQVLENAHAETVQFAERQKADYTAKVTAWEQEVKADPELGGEHFARTTLRSKTVLDRFTAARPEHGKQLQEALQATGFGNYKALVAFFDYYGSLMESDGGVLPQPNTQDARSMADRMFPSSAGK